MAIKGDILWEILDPQKINKETLRWFCVGAFSFINKNGEKLCFDFLENMSSFLEDDRYIGTQLLHLDHDFITGSLEPLQKHLEQAEYNLDFFENGKIILKEDVNEIHCCIDFKDASGKIIENINAAELVRPIQMAIYDNETMTDEDDVLVLYDSFSFA